MARFCEACGGAMGRLIPEGDNRERDVCTTCGLVRYHNPCPVAATIVEQAGRILLCRRAIEPRVGAWTTPGGFLELGESAQEGARRETREEACAEVEILAPHALLDIPHIGQSYVVFRAALRGAYAAGPESLEVRLFELAEIPWDELAFPVLHLALRWFVDETEQGRRFLHSGAVTWSGEGDRYDIEHYEVRDYLRTPLSD